MIFSVLHSMNLRYCMSTRYTILWRWNLSNQILHSTDSGANENPLSCSFTDIRNFGYPPLPQKEPTHQQRKKCHRICDEEKANKPRIIRKLFEGVLKWIVLILSLCSSESLTTAISFVCNCIKETPSWIINSHSNKLYGIFMDSRNDKLLNFGKTKNNRNKK